MQNTHKKCRMYYMIRGNSLCNFQARYRAHFHGSRMYERRRCRGVEGGGRGKEAVRGQAGANGGPIVFRKVKCPKITVNLCLDGRPWAQLCRITYCFGTFQFSEIKRFFAANLANVCLINCQGRSWNRRGVISCAPHTSFDEINGSVVNSERGELVRGSDPPFVHSAHSTAGDVWRAPIRLLLKNAWRPVCRKLRRKLSIASHRAKYRTLSGFDGQPQDNTSNL